MWVCSVIEFLPNINHRGTLCSLIMGMVNKIDKWIMEKSFSHLGNWIGTCLFEPSTKRSVERTRPILCQVNERPERWFPDPIGWGIRLHLSRVDQRHMLERGWRLFQTSGHRRIAVQSYMRWWDVARSRLVVWYERRWHSRLSLASVVCWLQVAYTYVIKPSVITI
jgi:hypothetical protein